jgi:hypothetical protein
MRPSYAEKEALYGKIKEYENYLGVHGYVVIHKGSNRDRNVVYLYTFEDYKKIKKNCSISKCTDYDFYKIKHGDWLISEWAKDCKYSYILRDFVYFVKKSSKDSGNNSITINA